MAVSLPVLSTRTFSPGAASSPLLPEKLLPGKLAALRVASTQMMWSCGVMVREPTSEA